jgi:hypothetical protein
VYKSLRFFASPTSVNVSLFISLLTGISESTLQFSGLITSTTSGPVTTATFNNKPLLLSPHPIAFMGRNSLPDQRVALIMAAISCAQAFRALLDDGAAVVPQFGPEFNTAVVDAMMISSLFRRQGGHTFSDAERQEMINGRWTTAAQALQSSLCAAAGHLSMARDGYTADGYSVAAIHRGREGGIASPGATRSRDGHIPNALDAARNPLLYCSSVDLCSDLQNKVAAHGPPAAGQSVAEWIAHVDLWRGAAYRRSDQNGAGWKYADHRVSLPGGIRV